MSSTSPSEGALDKFSGVDPCNDLYTMGMLKDLFILNMMQLVGSAILFAAVYAVLRERLRRPGSGPEVVREWDVLAKKDAVVAFPTLGGPFSVATAFGYAAFFHYLIPLWWYRWGVLRTLALIATPFVCTFLLTKFGVVPIIESISDRVPMDSVAILLTGACVQVPMRVAFGVYVGKNDVDFRRNAHFKRGWLKVRAGIPARSSAEAIESYRYPAGKPQEPSLRERIGKLVATFGRTA